VAALIAALPLAPEARSDPEPLSSAAGTASPAQMPSGGHRDRALLSRSCLEGVIMRTSLKRAGLLAGLTAAVLLTSSLVPVNVALAQRTRCADGNCAEYKAFENSFYGFCDAVVLGKYWGVDSWETKLRIGDQVMQKKSRFINQELHDAFARYNCNDVSRLNDASKIAELWTAGASS
jgi:hypothetical protein